ncbi:MAG: 16S rRNA (guanine(527)-N(7))-methyltransferase RsmG [Erysipelotrichaceae bacterium]
MGQIFHHSDFEDILKSHGIELSEEQLKQFKDYAELLQEWNKKMNLTAIDDLDGIYEKHFLDSVLPSFDLTFKGKICDVGAGAGFPSIPLKICNPDLEVTIVEPLGKRITFLKELVHCLGIHDVKLCNERSEDHALKHREEYDVVIARAVANLTMLSELCIPLVKKNGIFFAMKGDKGLSEYQEAKYAVELLGCKLSNEYEKTLIDGSKRINLVFTKIKATPSKYPRSFAMIKKNPLERR